jgi:curved DNA-binding protein CbpA
MTSQAKDFYAVLGVSRNSTAQEIKKRFLDLARERHPDRFKGEAKAKAESEFQEITEAFNVLTDPSKRRQLDVDLARPAGGQKPFEASDVVRVYLNRGIRAFKEGKWLEAATNFDRAVQSDQRNVQAWHHLALTCLKEERWINKAQEAIERALELEPSNATYLKLAGKIFAQSGMVPRAKQYYNEALKVGGPDAAVKKALEELGGSPPPGQRAEPGQRTEPDKGKPGLFRKIW